MKLFRAYRQMNDHYTDATGVSQRSVVSAPDWWDTYGSRSYGDNNNEARGELRRIAMRVTSCIAGAAAAERAQKEMTLVQTKSRNRLSDIKMDIMV